MAGILSSDGASSTASVLRVTSARTFPQLLAQRLQHDPGQPLVTAYDETTGERTELSVTTYANWVNKTANLLTDELGLDPGDTLLIDLPPHWLVPVFLGAAWSAGLSVTDDRGAGHDVAVCGPESIGEHDDAEHVLACSMLPFAVRFSDPVPGEVLDFGLLWPGQSDVFVAVTPPSPDTVAWVSSERPRTHADLLEEAAFTQHEGTQHEGTQHEAEVRLLTDMHPAAQAGVPVFLAPMVHGGSVVLLRHPAESTWTARREDERATVELRACDQPPSL
jgi:uncharacterized protein (TIGR03089 family)